MRHRVPLPRPPRLPKERGWAGRQAKGPNGRGLCRQCGVEVPKGRFTFCSDTCVHEWKCRSDPGYQAEQLFKRERGVCQQCGLDCHEALAQLKQLSIVVQYGRTPAVAGRYPRNPMRHPYYVPGRRDGDRVPQADQEAAALELARWFERLGLKPRPSYAARSRLWEMDHVVAVEEGGGSCGLEGLTTKCPRCHRAKTREHAARRAERRRRAVSGVG